MRQPHLPASEVFPVSHARTAARLGALRRRGSARRRRRVGAGITIALSALAGIGLAQAYFRIAGHATAVTQVEHPAELPIRGTMTSVPEVHPGGAPQPVEVTLTNPNPRGYRLTGLDAVVESLPAACPAGAFSVRAAASLPTLAARTSVTVRVGVTLARDAPAACQDARGMLALRLQGVWV